MPTAKDFREWLAEIYGVTCVPVTHSINGNVWTRRRLQMGVGESAPHVVLFEADDVVLGERVVDMYLAVLFPDSTFLIRLPQVSAAGGARSPVVPARKTRVGAPSSRSTIFGSR